MKKRQWPLLVLLMLPSGLAAHTVLKGGGKISGRIVTRSESEVEVDVGAGTTKVAMADVDRIAEGSSAW